MESVRVYGGSPYRVLVVHGGPGAPGYMAPVARRLAAGRGVLEPLQTARTLDGQIDELARVVAAEADPPVVLVGSSWGAMLSYLVTAAVPHLVAKLVMVGSASFDASLAAPNRVRIARLEGRERAEARLLVDEFARDDHRMDPARVRRLDELLVKADHYDPLDVPDEIIEHQHDVNRAVWSDVKPLRASGDLARRGRTITCPVVVVHGDHDSHALDGVVRPLEPVVGDLRVVTLARCGHLPWIERHAAERFYEVLERELDETLAD